MWTASLTILAIVLLLASLIVCWAATIFGAPGNWLMVASCAVYAWLAPTTEWTITWQALVIASGLALVGEIVELVATSYTTRRAGGSRKSAMMAIVGSVVGALVGILIGVPIPIVGPIIAGVLFASLGAMAGAMLVEQHSGRSGAETWQVGKAAFVGRILGTGSKLIFGAAILIVAIVALVVH